LFIIIRLNQNCNLQLLNILIRNDIGYSKNMNSIYNIFIMYNPLFFICLSILTEVVCLSGLLESLESCTSDPRAAWEVVRRRLVEGRRSAVHRTEVDTRGAEAAWEGSEAALGGAEELGAD